MKLCNNSKKQKIIKTNSKDECFDDQTKGAKILYSFKKTQSLSDVRSLSKTILTIFLGVLIRRSNEGKYPKLVKKHIFTRLSKEPLFLKIRKTLKN